jgi:arylsulfatase A-like enzyme
MINTLKSQKKWSNTILILTSDHGEIFGKKGSFTHNSLYEEVIHVPFIISHPKLKPKRISTIVSTLDIFPTIVSFIENKKDVVTGDKSVFNGVDRKRIITYHVRSESIIAWPWKLIRWRNGKDELYNLERDPTEKDDLSEESKLISEQLKFHLKSDKYKYFRSKTIL